MRPSRQGTAAKRNRDERLLSKEAQRCSMQSSCRPHDPERSPATAVAMRARGDNGISLQFNPRTGREGAAAMRAPRRIIERNISDREAARFLPITRYTDHPITRSLTHASLPGRRRFYLPCSSGAAAEQGSNRAGSPRREAEDAEVASGYKTMLGRGRIRRA